MLIIPAILTNDPDEARSLLALCEDKVKRIQIDIIDGEFANNKTITPVVFEDSETKVFIDYHLMVNDPINWIAQCARGAGDRVIGQIEMMPNQEAFILKAQELGIDVGLAIDLETPVHKLDHSLFADLDVILVMSVKAGFGGQEFHHESLEKIKELARIRDEHGYSYNICDDGGITTAVVDNLAREGADEVAVGKRIFEGDLEENIEQFKKAAIR